jgi:hypothetical protein
MGFGCVGGVVCFLFFARPKIAILPVAMLAVSMLAVRHPASLSVNKDDQKRTTTIK